MDTYLPKKGKRKKLESISLDNNSDKLNGCGIRLNGRGGVIFLISDYFNLTRISQLHVKYFKCGAYSMNGNKSNEKHNAYSTHTLCATHMGPIW